PRLQRLVGAAARRRLDAGRQIYWAALAARLRRGLPARDLASELQLARAFRGTCPALEAVVAELLPSDNPFFTP
ncbi:MAG: hypothetical protein D6722_08050, partial [Bacteroidetes bacterium]